LKVAILMGSDSDLPVIKKSLGIFKDFGVEFEVRVISAHRTPDLAHSFATSAAGNNFEVIIAAAGKAAHLAGVIAAYTTLPVIGLPIKSPTLDGLDSLLSVVQMPKGIPVATVAIDGAENAAILAIQILAVKYTDLKIKLAEFKQKMADDIAKKDAELVID